MRICPHCAHANREGALICEKCQKGLNSEGGPTTSTRKLDSTSKELAAKATWGTASFAQNKTILLRIRDVQEAIVLQPAKRTILGRSEISSGETPDLDLEPYDALEKGVSRKHASINRNEHTLTIVDLNSSNGTYLNGQRLLPDQPRVLRDGDEIRLGRLVAHIYFK